MCTFKWLFVALLGCVVATSIAQTPALTANQKVPSYQAGFQYGSNQGFFPGYNNGKTSDKLIGDLLLQAGRHTNRLALYDQFIDVYGTNIRLPEFKYYTDTLGFSQIALYLSKPSDAHRATDSISCVNVYSGKTERFRSEMFKNLYLPIWDDSVNGKTPINDQNYYAAYVYKVAKAYGKYITFYEVLEQPDYAANENVSKVSGEPGNWWDENPSPCDLTAMRAPFPHYVRALRITYEVVKSINPNALVATGGLGFPNFLDAILRNTDNPNGGEVSAQYPLTGGAYFDVVNFQSYPQYDLKIYDQTKNEFIQTRHSDAAAQKVIKSYARFMDVLARRGYDGYTYPLKHAILSEVNIPRKFYADKGYIGSAEAQRNFIMKTFVLAQKVGIKQMYTYTAGDTRDESASTSSNDGKDLMGMYYNLNQASPQTVEFTETGLGGLTLSNFLYGYTFDAALTDSLKLPSTIDGGVFSSPNGVKVVLWMKTTQDLSESKSGNFAFPRELKVTAINVREWDYAKTGVETRITGRSVPLTGAPVMLTLESPLGLDHDAYWASMISVYPNPARHTVHVQLNSQVEDAGLEIVDLKGIVHRVYDAKQLKTLSHQLPLEGLSPGIYMLKFQSDGHVAAVRLVVE